MARNSSRLPPLGTNVGGTTEYGGFVPILNASGKINSTMLPPATRSFTQTKSCTIEFPVGGEVIPLVYTTIPLTITRIIAQAKGMMGDSVTFNVHFGGDTDMDGTKVLSVDTSDIATDGIKNISALANFEVPENTFLYVKLASVTGTPVQFHVTVVYV